jgi:ribosomal protein S12 methylthiotransferase accessory factor
MGCDLLPSVALDKAIFELCQARPSEAMRFRDKPPAGRLKCYQDVVKLEDHPAFHGLRENSHEFDFLWSTQEKVPLNAVQDASTDDVASNLCLCVERLVSTGHRMAYAELTTPDVASVGFRVIRAIATGLQPIHFGWGEARLGGRRLFDAPLLWGLRDLPTRVEDLNLCPHPLA